ncbi:PREDICTED: COX assembly mitochondrial protein homolog [Polistes canadensis]|uniref:COX assembly mitochondrial protein homolog n=1 Tax=Polistes canadensis TaxID=91411 RepID=UPI000718F134|nr:PREDICTED: COX assembly mitochondrial protein homolog [Polistes canadensis]
METNTSHVLPPKYSSGPHGLGDPNDKSLRKVELNVLIPQVIRDRAKAEKCFLEVEEFKKCCQENNLSMVFKCRTENNKLTRCLERWFHDKDFQEECKQIYLQERSEYRKTNVSKKLRNIEKEQSK